LDASIIPFRIRHNLPLALHAVTLAILLSIAYYLHHATQRLSNPETLPSRRARTNIPHHLKLVPDLFVRIFFVFYLSGASDTISKGKEGMYGVPG
jgi:hypothetical protein